MRLWVMSDVHLEMSPGWDLPSDSRPDFDVLIIAGDLMPRMERGVRWLQDRVQDRPIIYVAGNHEFYGTDIDRAFEKAKEAAVGSQIFILERSSIRLGDVTFAGATTWTDFSLFGDPDRAMRVAGERMNDFRRIRTARYQLRFLPHHALARHLQARAFLEAEIRKPRSERLVVVTHHAPIPRRGYQRGDPPDSSRLSTDEILEAAYRSDLRSLMSPSATASEQAEFHPPDLWVFGHTHESEDTVIGGTRVVSNAKGYGYPTWDNAHFDPKLIIKI
jgi:predicted phosphodiesterase